MDGVLMSKLALVYNDVEITQQRNGHLNATAMCQANGKLWADYARNQATVEFIEALSVDMGIPISKLVVTRKGGNRTTQGTWIHPHIAMHLAQWLSPQFAVRVSKIVIERLQEESNPELALKRGRDRAAAQYRREGRSEGWIHERIYGKEIRQEYTHDLKEHGCEGAGYALCTDAIYMGVLGGKCKTLKTLRGLDDKDSLRDHLPRRELTFTRFAEELASMKLDEDNAHGNEDCLRASTRAARLTREAIDKMKGGVS
jgi:hypothetical protein